MARAPNVNQLFAEQFSFRAPVTPQRLAMPPQETLQAAPVSWRDRLKDALGGVIGRHNAEMAVQLADFTPLGAVFAANEARLAADRGGYGEAAGGLAMAALPIPAARGAGKVAREVAQEVPTISTRALAMDEASRMARAREMGFDTSRPLYHGTRKNFGEFEASDRTGYLGSYFAPDPDFASGFARDEGQVMPVLGPKSGVLDVEQIGPFVDDETLPELLRALPKNVRAAARASYRAAQRAGGDVFVFNVLEGDPSIGEALRKKGVSAVKFADWGDGSAESATVILDPVNIRSKFAAFDPAKRNSKNLMAGVAGAGVTGAATITTRSQSKDDGGI